MVEFEKYGFKPDGEGRYTFEDTDQLGVSLELDAGEIFIKVTANDLTDFPIGKMPATNQSLALLLKTFGVKR